MEAVQLPGLEVGDAGGFLRDFPHHQFGEFRGLPIVVFHGLEAPRLPRYRFDEFPSAGACAGEHGYFFAFFLKLLFADHHVGGWHGRAEAQHIELGSHGVDLDRVLVDLGRSAALGVENPFDRSQQRRDAALADVVVRREYVIVGGRLTPSLMELHTLVQFEGPDGAGFVDAPFFHQFAGDRPLRCDPQRRFVAGGPHVEPDGAFRQPVAVAERAQFLEPDVQSACWSHHGRGRGCRYGGGRRRGDRGLSSCGCGSGRGLGLRSAGRRRFGFIRAAAGHQQSGSQYGAGK